MCNDCFVENLKNGSIKTTPTNRNHITETNLKKMT